MEALKEGIQSGSGESRRSLRPDGGGEARNVIPLVADLWPEKEMSKEQVWMEGYGGGTQL